MSAIEEANSEFPKEPLEVEDECGSAKEDEEDFDDEVVIDEDPKEKVGVAQAVEVFKKPFVRRVSMFVMYYSKDTTQLFRFLKIDRAERLRQVRCFFTHINFPPVTIWRLTQVKEIGTKTSASAVRGYIEGRVDGIEGNRICGLYLKLRHDPSGTILAGWSLPTVRKFFADVTEADGTFRPEKWSTCPQQDVPGGECRCSDHPDPYINTLTI